MAAQNRKGMARKQKEADTEAERGWHGGRKKLARKQKGDGKGMARTKFELPDDKTNKPLDFPYFPTVLQAVVWRNWGVVPAERIALALGAAKEDIVGLAQEMGLSASPYVDARWLARGYATIIRNNWHLLPYSQLLALLGWNEEKLAFMLKEDDFLHVKLGYFKPAAAPVRFHPLNEGQKRLTAKMRHIITGHFPEINAMPPAAPFEFSKAAGCAAFAPARRKRAAPSGDYVFLDESWNISYPDSHANVAAFARRFVSDCEKKWGLKLAASAKPAGAHGIALSVEFRAGLLPESHGIDVSSDNIHVSAVDEAGLLRGLHRLESMMDLAGGPFIEKISERYDTVFDLRLIYSYSAVYGDPLLDAESDPYPDALLSRYSKLGINGIWLQGILYSLVPVEGAPELSAGWKKRLENLARLVRRAAGYGIGVYLYMNEPRAMPETFFEKRPNWKGADENGLAALCVSVDGVRDCIRNSVRTLFTEVPGLAGLLAITMSENFTNCYSHSPDGKTSCPRCSSRSQAEVIAEANRLIAEGARSAKPDAKIIVWAWGWPPEMSIDAIRQLPANASLMCNSEENIPTSIAGTSGRVHDYSMSVIGPGEAALANWEAAKKAGLNAVAKVQVNNTWECAAVPYIPVANLVERHLSNIRDAGVKGLMLSWTLGGYPSVNLAMASKMYWTDRRRPKNMLKALAGQLYGESAAAGVTAAWRAFSEAFREFPFDLQVLYYAPQNCGPMNILHEGPTGHKPTMVCYPYDGLEIWRSIYPEEMFEDQFRKLSEGWKKGIDMLDKAKAGLNASEGRAENFADLENVARAAYCHFSSAHQQIRFLRLRDKLSRRGLEKDRGSILGEIIDVLDNEISLAKRLCHIARKDSRIGFEASNHYFYTQQDLMEKVINCEYLKEIYGIATAPLFQSGGLIPRPLGRPKSQPSPIPRGLPRGVASFFLFALLSHWCAASSPSTRSGGKS
jgi:hypothetical protein